MRVLVWLLRGLLLLLLTALAIKNSFDVELRFFFDSHWQAPLSLVVLLAVAGGVAMGMAAVLPTLIRQRRRLAQLERQLAAMVDAPSSDK